MATITWPPLLGHHYLAITTSRKFRRPLHTTPGYGFNRRSHQPNFLVNFLIIHLSGTQADFKRPKPHISWWLVICPPSQATNFLLHPLNPFQSQAFSLPACRHIAPRVAHGGFFFSDNIWKRVSKKLEIRFDALSAYSAFQFEVQELRAHFHNDIICLSLWQRERG